MSGDQWLDANQRVLVAELVRIRALVEGESPAAACEALAAARSTIFQPAAIDVLAAAFELTPFERDVLLLCAGVSMDSALAEACGAKRPYATFGLALSVFAGAHWSALTQIGTLRRSKLLHVHDELALTTSRVSIEERVLHYLAGVNYLDPRLEPVLKEPARVGILANSHSRAVGQVIGALEASDFPRIVQLIGDDAPAQDEVARRVAEHYDLRPRILNATDIPAAAPDAERMAALWNRESVLLGGALVIRVEDADLPAVARFAERLAGLSFIGARTQVPLQRDIRVRVDRLEAGEQKQFWQNVLGESAPLLNGSLDCAAAQFRLSSADIVRTARAVREAPQSPDEIEGVFWQACRSSVRTRLDDLAERIEPVATWGDLVLGDLQMSALRQISAHARQRLQVLESWGFAAKSSRGLGISVLFSGESGTGKTLAAEVLANELRLDLYRIDLSSMVSKYIGETEKNLRRVFDAAEESGAILLFDEADALFGKRSEVKDSHDRYANIEVSYLLQRMERYRGLAILTTNLKGGIDSAFQRRLQFVVPFPFPDAPLRERIWRGVFPRDTPLEQVDAAKLAQLNVAGGSIRNIAMNAAFLAADSGTPVGMSHLLQAARSEATKRERPFSDAEVRGWA
jgi:SpoVK/Ycf46/Vps4 family AAA+-type ATPase